MIVVIVGNDCLKRFLIDLNISARNRTQDLNNLSSALPLSYWNIDQRDDAHAMCQVPGASIHRLSTWKGIKESGHRWHPNIKILLLLCQVRSFIGVVYSWVYSTLQEEIDRKGKGHSINLSMYRSININQWNNQSPTIFKQLVNQSENPTSKKVHQSNIERREKINEPKIITEEKKMKKKKVEMITTRFEAECWVDQIKRAFSVQRNEINFRKILRSQKC